MKPIDPRLLRYARATRFFLAAVVVLGLAGAGLVVAQAMLIAEVVVGAFQRGADGSGLRTPLLLLVAVAVGRGLVSWLTELAAHRAAPPSSPNCAAGCWTGRPSWAPVG